MTRFSIAASLLLASLAPAAAAPPASCAGKYVGRWTHTGGNNSTVTADGRATCEDHAFCVKGATWTCDGNVFIYTNSGGTWNYTLAPDGRTMSVGSAVATRLGPVPASARARDLGTASNVAADVLGMDRTPSAAPRADAPAPKPATVAAPKGRQADPEAEANAKEARKFFQSGLAAYKRGDWSAAEDDFSVAKERFRSAGMHNDSQSAANNARLAGDKRLRAAAARTSGPKPAPKTAANANKRSKEQCEQLEQFIIDRQIGQMQAGKNASASAGSELAGARGQLRRECQ
ncbi:hypothetical protein JQ561_33730 [Bradyrhizobium diazoefficiens]|nr:hypothetical protein [Bradyrhizobium diazoefficiens]MBR0931597.1 hypothetical protein [Bradyrhizobium diazoefficiens]